MRSIIWSLLLLPVLAVVIFAARSSHRPHGHWEFDWDDCEAPRTVSVRNNGAVVVESRAPRAEVQTVARRPVRTPRADSCGPVTSFDVDGRPRTNSKDAFHDALAQAANQIREYYNLRCRLPRDFVERLIVEKNEQPWPHDGELRDMPQVSLHLEVNQEKREQLARFEKEGRVQGRMAYLARVLAVVVAGLAAAAAYVRLDDWSKGYYAGLLKVLAIAAVIGASIGVWQL